MTVAAALSRKDLKEALQWTIVIPCQLLASLTAVLILDALVPANLTRLNAANYVVDGMSVGSAFAAETLASAAFTYAVQDHPDSAAVLGASLFSVHIFLVHLTGCSVNPARALAGAVAASYYTNLWVFMLAPMLGGCVAGVLLRLRRELDDLTVIEF